MFSKDLRWHGEICSASYLSFLATDGGLLWHLQTVEIRDEIYSYELSQPDWPLSERSCSLASRETLL